LAIHALNCAQAWSNEQRTCCHPSPATATQSALHCGRTLCASNNCLAEHKQLEHVALTQHHTKQGLKTFGEEGAQAVHKEMKQLDFRDVMEPIGPATLTKEQNEPHWSISCF